MKLPFSLREILLATNATIVVASIFSFLTLQGVPFLKAQVLLPIGVHNLTSILIAGALYFALDQRFKEKALFPLLLYHSLYELTPTIPQIINNGWPTGWLNWLNYIQTANGAYNQSLLFLEFGVALWGFHRYRLGFKSKAPLLLLLFWYVIMTLTVLKYYPYPFIVQIFLALVIYLTVNKVKNPKPLVQLQCKEM